MHAPSSDSVDELPTDADTRENPKEEAELEYIDLSGTGPIMDDEPDAGPQR